MALISDINVYKEIRSILDYLNNNSDKVILEETKKLYIRYLYLSTKVSTNNPSYVDYDKSCAGGNCYCYAVGFLTPEEFAAPYFKLYSKNMSHNIGFICGRETDISSEENIVRNFLLDLDSLDIKHYQTDVDR